MTVYKGIVYLFLLQLLDTYKNTNYCLTLLKTMSVWIDEYL